MVHGSAGLAVLALIAAAAAAQVEVAGDWIVEFSTRFGQSTIPMTLAQSGTRLTGYLASERSETPVTGTIDANRFRLAWEQQVEGKVVQVTAAGVVKGNTMTGRIEFADLANGPFYAERR